MCLCFCNKGDTFLIKPYIVPSAQIKPYVCNLISNPFLVTAPSNPSATISWTGAGEGSDQIIEDAPDGGFITTRDLTLTMSEGADQVTVMCQASNSLEIASTTVTVSVMCKY